ncbi:MAG TPA: helicase C-terminal domain-containing protein [Burkholderiaceae bacterium]|nr:helicase C-terminal domain-containing protein [Burkholderiaceae bacterium]
MRFTFAVAKGRGRYVCAARLGDKAKSGSQRSLDLQGSEAPPAADAARVARVFEELTAGRWNGDRDDLGTEIADDAWAELTTDRLGCSGLKCPSFAICPFYRARARVRDADVIVVNHDLLLAAAQMPAGSVLPDLGECLIVIDEAHALAQKAVGQFAVRHTLLGAVEWVDRVDGSMLQAVHALALDAGIHAKAKGAAGSLANNLEALHQAIEATGAFEEKPNRRLRNGVVPDWLRTIGERVSRSACELNQILLSRRERMLECADTEPRLVQRLLGEHGLIAAKVESICETWELMLRDHGRERGPIARWIEKFESGKGRSDFMICAAPISAAAKLECLLWRRVAAAVLTSATLTACGSFRLFLEETGLVAFGEKKLLRLSSPFDYPNRATLVVPRMRSNPKLADAHTAEVVELLPALLKQRGALVLFASGQQMRRVYASIPDDLRSCVLMQGTLPRTKIISHHAKTVEAGGRSIIFGLASFSEGVDLPGELCTNVVVVKLPFAVPHSPIEEARREWIESQGRSAFLEFSVPEVGVRLSAG